MNLGKEIIIKKIITIVGARPQFVKAAVVSRLIRNEYSGKIDEFLVHTGQHYDNNMSDIFFKEMDIPEPDINLEVGSGSHGRMTGEMIWKIEEILINQKPDWVLVYGDTNSTLAGALAAGKLNIPLAHIEAGLRSFFKKMPEEQNRVLTDHLSDRLFCPTETSQINLRKEGITEGVRVVGDVMYDASLYYRNRTDSREKNIKKDQSLPQDFYLLTLHRAENTDSIERLKSIIAALNNFTEIPALFPVHPRTSKLLKQNGIELLPHIKMIEPVGFLEMLELEKECRFVVTDSGGLQKEAYFFEKPCITLRDQTEWIETVETGWNTLTGADTERISNALRNIRKPDMTDSLYGDGDAGRKIVSDLV